MKQRKMNLCAKVPNEGARRLAWWLGEALERDAQAFDTLAHEAAIDVGMIDRLLSGEMLPGWDIGLSIAEATGGAVWPADFRMSPRGGWFDRPAPREVRRAA